MGTILILAVSIAATLTAAGQYYTEYGRPLSGMSFAPPTVKAPPSLVILMKNINPASERFEKIYAAIMQRREGLDRAGFITRLKRGEVFTVAVAVPQSKCPDCDGWGKIRTEAKTPDRKAPCRQCGATGKTPATRQCQIRWANPQVKK